MSYFSTGAELLAAINGLGADKIGSFVPFDAAYYLAQYGDKADYDGSLSPLENFVKTGANKLYKPNAQFDPVFYADANPDLKALVNSGELNAADLLFHYLQYGLDEGRVATEELATGFDPAAYLEANPDVKEAVEAAAAEGAFGGSALNGAVAHYVKFGMAEGRPGGVDAGGEQPVAGVELEVGRDNLVGTAGDDTFYAPILDNKNTFETGDRVNGGAGYDTLEVDLGDSQAFAIQPTLTNVEAVKVTVQTSHAFDDDQPFNDNNITDGSQIDAQRTAGVVHWESNNSRADLVIEDVRILDNQITKDVTIAFVDSDPGNVDFAVYFDQQSLRKQGASSTSQLTVSISNPLETSKGYNPDAPLADVPYDTLSIELNGERVDIALDLTDVETYDDLYEALQAAIAANESTAGLVEITRIRNGESFFSRDGEPRTADQFVLSAKDTSLAPVGWNASGGLPSDNAFSAIVTQGAPITESFLITSTVILDNVGRGSTGGDLVIGGMSVGTTSESDGVEQFDITVERSSKLQQIGSTNDTLEVVTIKSGAQYREWVNGVLTDLKYGDLTVLGDAAVDPFNAVVPNEKPNLPGSRGNQPIDGLYGNGNGFGFTNVRVIDASDFHGKANLNVVLDERVTAKYMDLFDTQDDPAGDNIEFQYTLGTNDDNFFLSLSAANFQAGGTTVREDFDLLIDGGTGNEIIDTVVYDTMGSRANGLLNNNVPTFANWYWNSALNANLAINAGAGNDTVATHGSGDWRVDLGAGADTYYADNSGNKAIWVLNALPGTANINNIGSGDNDVHAIIKGRLTVTVTRADGSSYTTDVVTVPSTNGVTSDLQINQAIKEAINSDDVLSKQLKAEDGPANTLVVRSLIDGTTPTLSVNLSAPTAASLTLAEVSAYALKHNMGAGVTAAQVVSAINAAITGFYAESDYVPQVLQAGTNSGHVADNIIIGGEDDDVLVLGTGAQSNDTVKYEGFGNGYDTIVNFDESVNQHVTNVVKVGLAPVTETFTVAFADLELTNPGTPATLDIDGNGPFNIEGAPNNPIIPGTDVAYEVYLFVDGGGVPGWTATYDGFTNQVTFISTTPNDDVTNLTLADFVFTGVDNTTPVTLVEYTEGREPYSEGTLERFTVDFNGSAAIADDNIAFDGTTVNYEAGDGPIELAAKVAAASYANWTVVDQGNGVVEFTAKTVGDKTDATATDFDHGTNGIVAAVNVVNGTASTGQWAYDQVVEFLAGKGDYLDFSSYDADGIVVNSSTVVGSSSGSATYISLTENTPAYPGEGVYLIALVNADGNPATNDVQTIGVADFGRTVDFVADNFIL